MPPAKKSIKIDSVDRKEKVDETTPKSESGLEETSGKQETAPAENGAETDAAEENGSDDPEAKAARQFERLKRETEDKAD